jgi:glutamate dehydrogenase
VKQVQQRLENNALLEWACIWNEHERTGAPRCVLTDQLSLKINDLNDGITHELWETSPIKRQILESAIPPVLNELIGIDKVMQRVPTNYLQAIFGAYIASHYIYHSGLQASELHFYRWMNN